MSGDYDRLVRIRRKLIDAEKALGDAKMQDFQNLDQMEAANDLRAELDWFASKFGELTQNLEADSQ